MKKGLTHTERVLNIWAIVLITWSVYRAFFKIELGIWIDEFIAKPLIFILPVYLFVTRSEKRPFLQSIGLTSKSPFVDIIVGFLLGSVFFVAGIAGGRTVLQPTTVILAWIPIAFATSISEEIISRGFVLNRLYEESKNIFTAPLFASILYFFLNVPMIFTTPGMTGSILVKTMMLQIILSLALSFLYLFRKNIYAPIIVHAMYILSIYLSI